MCEKSDRGGEFSRVFFFFLLSKEFSRLDSCKLPKSPTPSMRKKKTLENGVFRIQSPVCQIPNVSSPDPVQFAYLGLVWSISRV